MRDIRFVFFRGCCLIALLLIFGNINAQLSKDLGRRYSRWTVEVNAGLPFLVGNLTSLPDDKTYIGLSYGMRAGFQLNRAWGFGLSVMKGHNKMGARGYASDFLLGTDGMTYYLPQEIETYPYKDIYSDVNFISGGFYADINLNHLFGGSTDHWYSFMLIPGIYVHQFSSVVKTKENDTGLFPKRTALSWGAGIDGALRFRISRLFDAQLRSGITWITDNDFVGLRTPILARYNYMWNTSVGLIFKIPERGKRGNVMYAPRNGECYWE